MAPGILAAPDRQAEVTTPVVTKHAFPDHANTADYARSLDSTDPLRDFRNKFLIPSKKSLKTTSLSKPKQNDDNDPGTYLCGNSLGLQPKCMSQFIQAQLDTWSSINVYGHFRELENSPLKPWQSLAEIAAEKCSRIVGALPEEVAIENTLSVNLHLLMASFYRPTASRNKILLEWKAFPSDHVCGLVELLCTSTNISAVCNRISNYLAWI